MDSYDEMKRKGLVVSYYLSRCDKDAVKALGYNGFSDAFNGIAKILKENPNNIKNMRDEFDPYFDNGRKGWYQRPLRASRQEVFDEFKSYTDKELEEYVKKLLKTDKGGYNMDNDGTLKDLGGLIRQSAEHYNQDYVWQDVILTNEFKDAYTEYLDGSKASVEFFGATAVITTPMKKNIYVPNQWFAIAAYAVGVYSELHVFKSYYEQVAERNNERRDSFAKQLRDDTSSVNKEVFIDTSKKILDESGRGDKVEKSSHRLWRFTTDYSWWMGQKTIDRGDFYISPILTMLNLVAVSQGYVADIVNAYGTDEHLRSITKRLDGFTTNMEGVTYDFLVKETEENAEETATTEEIISRLPGHPTKHKITISTQSLNKIKGRK